MPDDELSRRVLHAALGAGGRLAAAAGLPLKEVRRWAELATFQALRDDGLPLREIAERLGVSMRKAAELSQQLRANFLRPEREAALPRRIEFLIWAGPISTARVCQFLSHEDPVAVEDALEQLEVEGRIREIAGRTPTWELTSPHSRLVRDDWLARIDGLNNIVATLANVIRARFFRADDRAMARHVAFRLRAQDREALQRLYEEQIWPTLAALDEAARSDTSSDSDEVELALLWSPKGLDGPPLPGDS